MSSPTTTPSPTSSSSSLPEPEPLSPPHPAPSRSPSEELDSVPEEVTIQLNFRKAPALAAHNRRVANLPDPAPWQYNWERDTYNLLCARIRDSIPKLPGVRWEHGAVPYVKPTRHATAKLFLQLDEDNFLARLKQAWRMEERRLGEDSEIVLQIFAYLTYPDTRPYAATGSAGRNANSTIQRATGPRKAAAAQRLSDAVASGKMTALGPITQQMFVQRLAQNARQPEPDEDITIPQTATYVQAQHLDAERARFERTRKAQDQLDQSTFRRVRMRIEGDLYIDVSDLRSILGILQFDLNGLGNILPHPVPRPQEDVEDVDHADPDDE